MTSLREELLGGGGKTPIPPFRMIIPPGWRAHATTPEAEKELLGQAARRLAPAHRVDLQGLLALQVATALRRARSQGALAMVLPGPDARPALFAPASLLVMVRDAPVGSTMDAYVVDVIRTRGGRPLDTDERFVRWVTRGSTEVDGQRIGSHLVEYLTPVPGSAKTQALHLAYSLAHPMDMDPAEDPRLQSWVALMDAHVATLSWENES